MMRFLGIPMPLRQGQSRLEARVGIKRGSFEVKRMTGAIPGCDDVPVRKNVILKLTFTTREISVFRYRANGSGSTTIDGLERYSKTGSAKRETGGGNVWRSIDWS